MELPYKQLMYISHSTASDPAQNAYYERDYRLAAVPHL